MITPEYLEALLVAASEAHHDFEAASGKPDENWANWYAAWMHDAIVAGMSLESLRGLARRSKEARERYTKLVEASNAKTAKTVYRGSRRKPR
jgi:hypothetical protein